MADADAYPLIWYWRSRLPERKGQRCRTLAPYGVTVAAKGTVLVEFEDGYRVYTSRYAVRAHVAGVHGGGVQ